MNRKRILLVSLGILGILTVVLGAAGFVLTSRSSAKVDEALTESPAALTSDQSAVEYEARDNSFHAVKQDKPSGYEGYSSGSGGCSHDSAQSIDWANED